MEYRSINAQFFYRKKILYKCLYFNLFACVLVPALSSVTYQEMDSCYDFTEYPGVFNIIRIFAVTVNTIDQI